MAFKWSKLTDEALLTQPSLPSTEEQSCRSFGQRRSWVESRGSQSEILEKGL
jgi:hypothetical protein